MKTSKWQYWGHLLFFIPCWGIALLAAAFYSQQCANNSLNFQFLIGLLAFSALGWFFGLFMCMLVLVPIVNEMNGAPFYVGDWVRILTGPHKGTVARVYDVRPYSNQLFVDLGAEEKRKTKDRFTYIDVCRSYTIKLTARNEGIEYRDDNNIYRFNVALKDNVWTVYLPGSKGKNFEQHTLDKYEEDRILPVVIRYLSNIKWLVFFPRSYSVIVDRKD